MEQIANIVGAVLMIALLVCAWVISVGYIAGVDINLSYDAVMPILLVALKIIVGIALIVFTIVVIETIKDIFNDW